MSTYTCPDGHTSQSGDYCDVCGLPIQGAAGAATGSAAGSSAAGSSAAGSSLGSAAGSSAGPSTLPPPLPSSAPAAGPGTAAPASSASSLSLDTPAAATGNEEATSRLRKVVEIDDPDTGTVRLRRDVAKADEMALDTASTKTTRIRS